MGTALGVALLGAVLSTGYRSAVDSQLDAVPGVPDGAADTAREGVANAIAAAGEAGQAEALVQVAKESFVVAWQQAMWAGSAVMVILFFHVLARGPRDTATAPSNDE